MSGNKTIYSQIHDRYIITKNHSWTVPSIDVIERGQFSNVSEIKDKVPFDKWWENSEDLISAWDSISRKIPQR